MNIKKFDIEKYYKEIANFTSKEDLEESYLCKTKNYDFKSINYIIPKDVFFILNEMINSFITENKTFKLNDIEKLISDYTFIVYKKRVAAKKISLFFVNFNIIENKIKTNNGFNFETL